MKPEHKPKNRNGARGSAVLEVSLLAPWMFFLFAGVFDMGFYATAMISVQNAARAAATHTSAGPTTAADSAGACAYARAELHSLYNVRSVDGCATLPLVVTAAQVTGADGSPASRVTVTYRTPRLIPIPGLAGQFTITRWAEMRLRES